MKKQERISNSVLNFEKEIADKIINGTAIHTILKGNDIEVGDKLYMFSEFGTKNCKKLEMKMPIEVKWVKRIRIQTSGTFEIFDKKLKSYPFWFLQEIAINNGFEQFIDMVNWFCEKYPKKEPFVAQIVGWTDCPYKFYSKTSFCKAKFPQF